MVADSPVFRFKSRRSLQKKKNKKLGKPKSAASQYLKYIQVVNLDTILKIDITRRSVTTLRLLILKTAGTDKCEIYQNFESK